MSALRPASPCAALSVASPGGERRRRFMQVDVFGAERYRGNALAVVIDGEGIDAAAMQRFARWTQLSETTFLLPPTPDAAARGADYRVRIWTPGGELPFAGHPTLGSCHAWLAAGHVPKEAGVVVQECGVGLVRIRHRGEGGTDAAGRLAFEAPPLRRSAPEPALVEGVLAALGADAASLRAAQWLDNGPHWLGLLLDSADAVLALDPDHAALKPLAKVGVIGPHAAGAGCTFEVRAFAAQIGIDEDPVTGSLNAGLAQWLMDEGVAPERYLAAQGARVGRAGRVFVERVEGAVWVGGGCVACVEGQVVA